MSSCWLIDHFSFKNEQKFMHHKAKTKTKTSIGVCNNFVTITTFLRHEFSPKQHALSKSILYRPEELFSHFFSLLFRNNYTHFLIPICKNKKKDKLALLRVQEVEQPIITDDASTIPPL